jgi:ribonuclease Z
MEGKDIGALKKSGVKVTDAKEIALFAYTGDTTIEGVLKHPLFLDAEVLVTECTYIDDEVDEKTCKERGHIHLREIFEHRTEFKGQLVLCHFSPRFSKDEIREAVDALGWERPPLLLI